MASLRLHSFSVVGTAVVFVLSLWINQEIFTHTEFVRGVNWIYLPTGVRLLSTLLLGADGASGLLVAGLLVDFCYFFPHDPVRAVVGAILSAVGPYAVYRLALERYDLRASLTNLTPRRLLVMALAVAITNPLLHHIWFALQGDTHNIVESFFMMFAGDLSGALIMLYIVKGILALLPRQPGSSRVTNSMFSIRLALTYAYNNRSA
jgi:hypothetical protein